MHVPLTQGIGRRTRHGSGGLGDGCLRFGPGCRTAASGSSEQPSFPHPEQARRVAAQNFDLPLAQIAKVAAREQSFLQGLRPDKMKT